MLGLQVLALRSCFRSIIEYYVSGCTGVDTREESKSILVKKLDVELADDFVRFPPINSCCTYGNSAFTDEYASPYITKPSKSPFVNHRFYNGYGLFPSLFNATLYDYKDIILPSKQSHIIKFTINKLYQNDPVSARDMYPFVYGAVRTDATGSTKVNLVIKFCSNYGVEPHLLATTLGLAPKIIAVNKVTRANSRSQLMVTIHEFTSYCTPIL